MLRTFHPIGQGAFYTEKFGDYNVVYDCGTLSKTESLLNEINHTFGSGERIDALFISHFDCDHINMVDFLLTYCDVKKIFIPLLNERGKIISLIKNYILNEQEGVMKNHNKSDFQDFIISPEDFVGGRSKIIYVKPYIKEEFIEKDSFFNIDQIENEEIVSGTKLYFHRSHNWFYIPYNYEETSRSREFMSRLIFNGITIDSAIKLSNNWEKYKVIIKKIYKKISGNINENSLVLYSGPNGNGLEMEILAGKRYSMYKYICGENPEQQSKNLPSLKMRLDNYQAGCLYFGDYDAHKHFDEIRNNFSSLFEYVGVVQIPHHGSKESYNNDIRTINESSIFIISAGLTNRHNHPDDEVKADLIENNRLVEIVTEEPLSRVKFGIF